MPHAHPGAFVIGLFAEMGACLLQRSPPLDFEAS
jgi:hypothetical protein